MKIKGLTIGILGWLVFSSCSSVRKLSAKDSPVTTTMAKKPKNIERKFIDQIEVTPGGVGADNTAAVSIKPAEKTNHTQITVPVSTERMASTNVENASMLQLKYAVAFDATVEMLTNIVLLQVIDKWWGTRYCMGGSTEDCLDCSAFTQIIMRDVYRQTLARTAQDQYHHAEKIELENLREGDLVFFNTAGKNISHVGVYVLNNKFVHAATSGGVMISDLNDSYWQPKYRGAGRVVK